MNKLSVALVSMGLASSLLMLSSSTVRGERGSAGPLGAWTLAVEPQAADGAQAPPPFTSVLTLSAGGALAETDTGLHPHSAVVIFPDLGALSSSDGLGAWEAAGESCTHSKFIKILFSSSGEQLGYIVTQLNFTLEGDDALRGESHSDFILGSDPDGEPFFQGKALVRGHRLSPRAQ